MIKRAIELVEQGEYDEALRIANQLLNNDPNDCQALFVCGHVFLMAERYGLAYNVYKRLTDLAPYKSEVWNNLGRCIQDANRGKEALDCFKKALEREPKNVAAMTNMSLIYVNLARPHDAIKWADRALAIDPTSRAALDNRALAKLMIRDWSGWVDYEASLGGPHRKERQYCEPWEGRWDGSKGKTVVVYGEQGLGDEILFASILPEAMRDANIILECDSRLEGLFKRSFPGLPVYGTRFNDVVDWPHSYEIQASCAMGSLPQFYRTKTNSFPGEAYLVADPLRRIQWRALLDALSDKPKIGIAWNGGKDNTGAALRCITLDQWAPILSQDATFISLEYKDPGDLSQYGIHHFARCTEARDYDETAALVAELDLVISVTTTVVHLAGALGIPCWCLTPNKPNWRFHLDGDIEWHDSVKLYRQTNTWPINQIASDLSEFLSASTQDNPLPTTFCPQASCGEAASRSA